MSNSGWNVVALVPVTRMTSKLSKLVILVPCSLYGVLRVVYVVYAVQRLLGLLTCLVLDRGLEVWLLLLLPDAAASAKWKWNSGMGWNKIVRKLLKRWFHLNACKDDFIWTPEKESWRKNEYLPTLIVIFHVCVLIPRLWIDTSNLYLRSYDCGSERLYLWSQDCGSIRLYTFDPKTVEMSTLQNLVACLFAGLCRVSVASILMVVLLVLLVEVCVLVEVWPSVWCVLHVCFCILHGAMVSQPCVDFNG